MKKPVMLLFTILLSNFLCANNLTVSNVHLTEQNTSSHVTMVKFDISWENSWRASAAPSNWDAAWIFIKYRLSGGTWEHARITPSGHVAPSGSTISAPSDGTGAFIFRDSDGTGTFTGNGVKIEWDYGLNGISDISIVDIRVFAIEMVYVPEGSFSLGSGGAETGHFYKYPLVTDPYPVTSENAILIGTTAGNLYGTSTAGISTIGPSGTLEASFPKGFSAFYSMKYELTQQDYADFLNSLTYAQQVTRTDISPGSPPGTYLYNSNRNMLHILVSGISPATPATYATDFQDVACNDLSWGDLTAFLDWSGLRPMTELEFEKACRGPVAPVANEFSWGTSAIANTAYSLSGGGTAGEVISANYSTTAGNAAYNLTVPLNGSINGPLRSGIFAGTPGNTGRISAGATYYGIMEMSGNVRERIISAGVLEGRSFSGTHGNGSLDANGNPDVPTWPGTSALGSGFRGGTWGNDFGKLRTSDRFSASNTADNRSILYGGRGIRIAP